MAKSKKQFFTTQQEVNIADEKGTYIDLYPSLDEMVSDEDAEDGTEVVIFEIVGKKTLVKGNSLK